MFLSERMATGRPILLPYFLALLGAGGSEPGLRVEHPHEPRLSGRVRVAVPQGFAPYAFFDELNEPAGFLVDLLRRIGAESEFLFRFVPLEPAETGRSLREGRVDLVPEIGSGGSPEDLLAGSPILEVPQSIFRNRIHRSDLHGIGDLRTHRVAIETGNPLLRTLNENRTFPLRRVQSVLEGMLLLDQGRVDAFVCVRHAGVSVLNRFGFDRIDLGDEEILPRRPVRFLVRRDSKPLLDTIEELSRRLRAEGFYKELARNWLHASPLLLSKRAELPFWASFLIGALLLLAGGIFTWNRSLRARIQRVSKRLEAVHKRWELAVFASRDGVWDWRTGEEEVWTNDRWLTMLGYAPGERPVTYSLWESLLHPKDSPRILDRLQEVLKGREDIYEVEGRLRCKDGSWKWILMAGTVVERDGGGRALRMIGTHKDIDARRRIQEVLERERRHFIGGPVVVFQWRNEPGWPVSYVSPNVVRIFGREAEAFLSGEVPYAEVVHPEDLERVAAEVESYSKQGVESFERIYRVLHVDGSVRWVHDFTIVGRDEEGALESFSGHLIDITERRRAEEESKRLEAQVLQAQKFESLGILAGGIAHDFNNLLTGILGHADLLGGVLVENEEARTWVRRIQQAARQAADLSRQMLVYSGGGGFRVEAVDLNEVVNEVLPILRSALSKKIRIVTQLSEELPPIGADRSQVRQVVMNLVTNAAESFEDGVGRIEILVFLRKGTDPDFPRGKMYGRPPGTGDCVCLRVEDNGAGMDDEIQDRIFDPFFTTKFTGRGLGLAAVLGIVRTHRGGILVRSRKGSGTAFLVYWPVSENLETSLVFESTDGVGEMEEDTSELGARILVVEDEAGIRDLAKTTLERAGCEVVTASNGREALEVFRASEERFSLVLLDLTMPVMGGEECLMELRALDPEIPIILSSGFSEQEVERRFRESCREGRIRFLLKPYRARDLRMAVRGILAGPE